MSNKKISELGLNTSINGSEEIALEKGGSNFKDTFARIRDWISQDISKNIDGGSANSVYLNEQSIDGGNA